MSPDTGNCSFVTGGGIPLVTQQSGSPPGQTAQKSPVDSIASENELVDTKVDDLDANSNPEVLDSPGDITIGGGQAIANKRITGNGRIVANGDNWIIRNVGFEGPITNQGLDLQVNGSDGSGVVENVYIGGVEATGTPAAFVNPDHAGLLTIINYTAENVSDSDGLDAAAPGAPPGFSTTGAGGVIEVEGSYALNCSDIGFRMGSDGSYIKDTVVDGSSTGLLGFWQRWQTGRYINSKAGNVSNVYIRVGPNQDPGGDVPPVHAELKNCIFDGGSNKVSLRDTVTTTWNGDKGGLTVTPSVNLSPPTGAPLSAKEASGGV